MKILRWLKPEKLIYLLPAIFPLYLLKVELFGLPTNLLELVTILLFVVLGGNWLIHPPFWQKEKSPRGFFLKQWWSQNKVFFLSSLGFLLIALLSALIVPKETLLIDGKTVFESQKVAFGILKGWIIIPYLYFFLLWFSVRNKSSLFVSLYAYIFSALPLVLWAFYQYATGDFITLDGRASGPFINANYLAMYLAPAVVALWVLITRGIVLGFKLKRFVIGVILAALYSVALLMTQSYGAMLAVLITLGLFFIWAILLHRKYQRQFELDMLKKIGYFLTVFGFIAVFSAILLFANTEKWQQFTNFNERDSSSVRLQVYQVAGTMVGRAPLLGIGLGQFEPLYNLQAVEILGQAPFEWVMLHPHDTLLAIWLNLGLLGLIWFLGLFYYCWKRCFGSHSYTDSFYRLIGFSMLLVMLIHGLVDTYLFKNDLAYLFWLVVALCLLPRNNLKEAGKKVRISRKRAS